MRIRAIIAVVMILTCTGIGCAIYFHQSSIATYSSEGILFTTTHEYDDFKDALLQDSVHIRKKEVLQQKQEVVVVSFSVRVPADMEFPYGTRSQDKGAAMLLLIPLVFVLGMLYIDSSDIKDEKEKGTDANTNTKTPV